MTRVIEIPLQSGMTHFSQQTELDGKTYTFEFEWIARDRFWMLHISDENGKPLVCGIKIVANWPLLRRDTGMLPGQIIALDSGGQSDALGPHVLAERMKLLYVS